MMQLPLFPDTVSPLTLAENAPSDPLIWIRRLRIVKALNAEAEVIRDIPFRRGVNIICTAERPPEEERTVGHSVGKTLLLRLIRFCLGERAFCTMHTRQAIAHVLQHAYVLAEIVIRGQSWVVARPIGLDSIRTASLSAKSDSFDVLFTENESRLKFSDYEQALEDATVSSFQGVTLPYARRAIQWLDLLAWLSRDQGCRYRSHTEWRIQANERAGSKLRPEDMHILIRTAMGLILPDEMELVLKHKQLERDRGNTSTQYENLKRVLEHLQAELTRSLELPSDLLGDTAFATKAAEQAKDKCDSLKRLLAEMEANNPAIEAEREYLAARDEYNAVQHDLSQLKGKKELAETHLRKLREATTNDEIHQITQAIWECSYYGTEEEARQHGCPGLTALPSPGIPDPNRAANIRRCEENIRSLAQQITPLISQADQLLAKVNDAEKRLHTTRQTYDVTKDKLRRRLGYYLSLAARASQYRKSCDTLYQLETQRNALVQQLKDSKIRRQQARVQVSNAKQFLSEVFDRALKQMLGDSVGGRIDIDSNGIFPRPTAETRANGDAMATSATVLGFDIACLIANVNGTGLLPRFWLHDSPREADMEMPMFHRIFRPIAELEGLFKDKEPSFQYIMTTTTRPPKDLDDEVHVRLELDAREHSGLLLRERF